MVLLVIGVLLAMAACPSSTLQNRDRRCGRGEACALANEANGSPAWVLREGCGNEPNERGRLCAVGYAGPALHAGMSRDLAVAQARQILARMIEERVASILHAYSRNSASREDRPEEFEQAASFQMRIEHTTVAAMRTRDVWVSPRGEVFALVEIDPEDLDAQLVHLQQPVLPRLPRTTELPTGAPSPRAATVERFPTLEAPDQSAPGQEFAVQVSLTVAQVTPEVRIPKGPVTPEGALAMVMEVPRKSEDGWTLDVFLSAPGLAVKGSQAAKILLPREGSSSPALFHLRVPREPPPECTLSATFFHEGRFLGQAVRVVLLETPSPSLQEDAMGESRTRQSSRALRRDVSTAVAGQAAGPVAPSSSTPPDLPSLSIWYEVGKANSRPNDPRFASVHVAGPLSTSAEDVAVPPDLDDWLAERYARLARFERGVVVADDAGSSGRAPAPDRQRARDYVQGLGRDIHDQLLPGIVQRALSGLPPGGTVHIVTNEPRIPWELAVPHSSKGGPAREPLGIEYRVSRRHIRQTREAVVLPREFRTQRLVAIAPNYHPRLPAQAQELESLRTVAGEAFHLEDGNLAGLRLWTKSPGAILHFAGHGRLTGTGASARYVLALEDEEMDLTEWKGLRPEAGQAGSFVFLNACDLGQATRTVGFVDGWGPAVMERGGTGFVGGLWPLGDRGASDWARRFYQAALGGIPVAEAARRAREGFRDTGDPSYLAYVVYGDPDLILRLAP